jgi:hypothetical protein
MRYLAKRLLMQKISFIRIFFSKTLVEEIKVKQDLENKVIIIFEKNKFLRIF